ncbi:MAG: acyltransferase [Verrucomicrobia bacterium]|nr:acyltransferase [Verrucomicrobiota bacterium]
MENIQALRGIAALLVVGFHALVYYFAFPVEVPMPRWAFTGASGVDIFFVISGFVMVHVTRNRFGSVRGQARFLADRVARIYPYYWLATLPVVLTCLALPRLTSISLNGKVLFESLLLLPQSDFPLLRAGWTLIHEMYFYLAFSFFLWGKRERLWSKLCVWALLVGCASLLLPAKWLEIPWVHLVSNPLTLEFIGGCFLALVPWPKGFRQGSWLLLGGFVLLLPGTLSMPFPAMEPGCMRHLYLGLPSILIVAAALAMEQGGQTLHWAGFQRLGDASFQIYLWHLTVISAVSRFSMKLPIPNGLRLLLTIGCAVVFGYLVYLWIEKPMREWTRGLRGKSA